MWADALALLVEDGQTSGPAVLLSRVVDQLTAERVRRALLGRLGATEQRFALAVEDAFRAATDVPAAELPVWAESGIVDVVGRRVFGRHTLDLDEAERVDGVPWPPITVMVIKMGDDPAAVLVEFGPGGVPQLLLGSQARRVGLALISAVDLTDEVNA